MRDENRCCFQKAIKNAEYCTLLQDFLLDDGYDGSDSQLGAAVILRRMDKSALAANKELVLLAQQNEVYWKRPLAEDDDLSWLS